MKQKYLLEISVETDEAATAAERGGANRIELCGDLSVGGVSPTAELMRTIRERLHIPIFAMIRPRGGDFVYSAAEFAAMKNDIASAKKQGMNGLVLGVLKADHCVDIDRTRELVELAWPLPVTYHRAFDDSADLRQALEDVIQTGATRILTSGGAPLDTEGATILAALVAAAHGRIVIVPGAGINASNILQVARQTRAQEFHAGLSSVLPRFADSASFEAEVKKLAGRLRDAGKETRRGAEQP